MRANDRQVGGSHYKNGGEEHWDRVARLKLNYFQARATAYIERAPKKGGKQDIEKAIHFLQKYLEVWDLFHPVEPARAPANPRDEVGWEEEQRARESYEIEGHRADGKELFKCKHCRQEGWGILALRNPVPHAPGCPLAPTVPGALEGP